MAFGYLGMKKGILMVVPILPIMIVSIFFSIRSFPANQRPVKL